MLITRNTAARRIGVTVSAGLGSLAFAASASAVPADYANFANCPVGNPAVVTCVYSTTTSGQFVLGNKAVPINQTIVLQGGITSTGQWVGPANGALALSEPELNVPGGILGIPGFEGPVLGVKSIAKLRGTPVMSIANFALKQNVALQLPVRIQLKNPALSSDCSIGSTSNPVVLNLTSGTTAPPSPNTPQTGATGTVSAIDGGRILNYAGYRLIDNSFAAPTAKWCDPFGTSLLVTGAVNLSVGLASAAGKNTADLNGNLKVASASNVRTNLGL